LILPPGWMAGISFGVTSSTRLPQKKQLG